MEPMIEFEIRCTTEQTTKAILLGASIYKTPYLSNVHGRPFIEEHVGKDRDSVYTIKPTAEQMTGWLRSKGVSVEYFETSKGWYGCAHNYHQKSSVEFTFREKYKSRKEAALAAIDAALEYLTKNKS